MQRIQQAFKSDNAEQLRHYIENNDPLKAIGTLYFIACGLAEKMQLTATLRYLHSFIVAHADHALRGKYSGATGIWLLAATPEGRAVLKEHPEALMRCDLNAAPTTGPEQGKTVACWLASTPEGRAILKEHPEVLMRCDLDIAPTTGPFQGKTVACWLASTSEGRAILKEHPEVLMRCDLDKASTTGPFQGKTLAYMLVETPDGLAILKEHPEILARCNLDTSPATGFDQGKTAAWILAATPDGLAILKKHPEVLMRCDLNASPKAGPFQGKTVACLLATMPEGLAILKEHPEVLTRCDLDAAFVSKRYPDLTFALWLASTTEGSDVLKMRPELLIQSNLKPSFILKTWIDLNVFTFDRLWNFVMTKGFSTEEFYAVIPPTASDEMTFIFDCDSLIKHVKQFDLGLLTTLLRRIQPLLNIKLLEINGGTILHLLIRELNKLDDNHLRHCLTVLSEHEEPLAKLQSIAQVTDANGFVPADYAKHTAVKLLFDASKSEVEKVFNQIFSNELYQLIRDVLCGKSALPMRHFKLRKWPRGADGHEETKELQVTSDEFINTLETALEQLASYIEAEPSSFTKGTLSTISRLAEEIDAASKRETSFGFSLLPSNLLEEKEAWQLEQFTNNFITLLHYHHQKEYDKRRPVDTISRADDDSVQTDRGKKRAREIDGDSDERPIKRSNTISLFQQPQANTAPPEIAPPLCQPM